MIKSQKIFYNTLNVVEITKNRLVHNYNYLSSFNNEIKIAPVLKSNAYGHGISLIGKVADEFKPPFICVNSLDEAYELSRVDVKSHILILGQVASVSLQVNKIPYSFTVFTRETVDALNKYQPDSPIHIFIDTGMHREGINLEELPDFLQYVQKNTKLKIEGLMSHLGMSDKYNDPLTKKQIDNFQIAQKILKDNKIIPKWIHIANSCGILNHKYYKNKLGNIARVGKAFYGYDPEGLDTKLLPSLELKTQVAQIKFLKKGEKVGYDFTYTAQRDLLIAILPIGYNDGVERNLSNVGIVTLKGEDCRIIGYVSMNLTTIDISNLKSVRVGDIVTVYSNNPVSKNSIDNSNRITNTITHELLVHINQSIKRNLIV